MQVQKGIALDVAGGAPTTSGMFSECRFNRKWEIALAVAGGSLTSSGAFS